MLGSTLPDGIIVMGVFTVILSGLGAFSALKENTRGLIVVSYLFYIE
jgi:hypothetical protein